MFYVCKREISFYNPVNRTKDITWREGQVAFFEQPPGDKIHRDAHWQELEIKDNVVQIRKSSD